MAKNKRKSYSTASGIREQLRDVKKTMASLTPNYRKALGREIQRIVGYADDLRKNKKQLIELYSDKVWMKRKKQPDPGNEADILRNLFLYVCGFEGNSKKDASFYYRSVSVLINDGVPTHQIADEIIKRGGLRNILEDHRQKESERNINEHDVDAEEDKENDIDKNTPSKASSNTNNSIGLIKTTMKDKRDGIFVETSQNEMWDIFEAHEGSTIELLVEVTTSDKNGFVNLKLIEHSIM